MVRADFFIQNAVNSYVGASGRQRADAGFIANTILKLPELPIQHRIASILSAYDDMIENNNRRIALLEQMAEQIYKEWFVRMRFPGYENTEFEKGVPKGWEVNPILTLCSKITDGTHDTPKPVDEGGVPLITGTHIVDGRIDIDSAYKISIDDHTKIKQRSYLDKGDIIFSNIGTIGSIAIVNEDFEYSVKNVIIFKPLSIEYSLFLYYMIKSPSVKEQLMLDSSGTSQKFITLGYIRKVKTVIPETELIKKFSQLVRPMFLEKSNLQLQTQTLKQIRDLLLPRLISGKLKVNELREFELV
jgi:type I restriction enzyme S subunit